MDKPQVFAKGDKCWVADDAQGFVQCTVKDVKSGSKHGVDLTGRDCLLL